MTLETDAPDFNQPGLTWLNVPKPITLGQVFGRIVILDFWTFSCVNCLHILPSMRRIERAFADDVVIIGVHSPNFPYERQVERVSKAIARYQIEHPIVHDPELKLWDAYQVKAWPTLILLSPEGKIFQRQAGEPDADKLLEAVGNAVRRFKAMRKLRSGETELQKAPQEGGSLRFPGQMARVTINGNKFWAVADTGHHQIVLLNDQGQETQRIGRGAPGGFKDGEFGGAAFDNPHSLAGSEDVLYVGEMGNHAIRKIDFKTKTVETLAGNTRRGLTLTKEVPAKETSLASVAGLALLDERLFFSNMGTHQIGELNLSTLTLQPFVGSGMKEIKDGKGRAAQLAQPSGLAFSGDGKTLYFADSDNSSIRQVDMKSAEVTTLAGKGMADSGKRNGAFNQARFQHPLGVARWRDALFVADTYNQNIRRMELKNKTVEDSFKDFTSDDANPIPLASPEGLAVEDNTLYVVDSSNHRIIAMDLVRKTWKAWAG
ncbi:MAG: thioredoxin-like domain-containing protein [Dongiaceae bacterium]